MLVLLSKGQSQHARDAILRSIFTHEMYHYLDKMNVKIYFFIRFYALTLSNYNKYRNRRFVAAFQKALKYRFSRTATNAIILAFNT